jgi:AraC-like DNA-binding protein
MVTMTEKDIEENPFTRLNIFSTCMGVHRHTFFEILLVESGTCLHYINDLGPIRASEKMVFLIRPTDCHHALFADKSTTWRDFYIPAPSFRALCDALYPGLYDKLMNAKPYLSGMLSVDEFNALGKKVSVLTQILLNGKPYPPQTEAIFKSIISDILVKFIENDLILKSNAPEWLNHIYLHMTYFDYVNLSIDEVIDKSGFSGGYLTSLFKKYYGQTLVAYHNKTKIMYSVNLLGKMKITDIASSLGWDNPKNYTANFRKVYGTSPKKYAMSLRSNFMESNAR